jgi:quercetin dioxygenase-like cupin family protein
LIDRAEVRVSRVELQPGATRSVHRHDDVEYHLWIPIEGSLELTITGAPPAAAKPGQAFFMTRGTSHGFKNLETTPAAVFEIFIKQTARAADRDLVEATLATSTAMGAVTRPAP